jgi:hypothetical protein
MPELARATRRALLAELEQLPDIDRRERRDLLLLDWPPALRLNVPRDGAAKIDLTNIVLAAADWQPPTGAAPLPLALLIENAADQVPGTAEAIRLARFYTCVTEGRDCPAPPHPQPLSPEGRGEPPLPAVVPDPAALYADLRAAYESKDYGRVLEVARRLPPDYPGVAPFRDEAQAAINALVTAYTRQQWAAVGRLAGAMKVVPPDQAPMVAEARARLTTPVPPLPTPEPAPARPWWRNPFFVGGAALIAVGVLILFVFPLFPLTSGPNSTPTVGEIGAYLTLGIVAVLGGVALWGLARTQLFQGSRERARLVSLLITNPAFERRATRDLLLLDLPPAVVTAIPRRDDPEADLTAMVATLDTWGALDAGPPALAVFLENALDLTPDMAQRPRLEHALAAARATPPAPDYRARYRLLLAAHQRGDTAAVQAIATALPPDYPGLGPLLGRGG